MLFRSFSVFLFAAASACASLDRQHPFSAEKADPLDSWAPPLTTRGRYVVDANGKRFKLVGGNWHGASGTYLGQGSLDDPANHHAGEVAYQTVLGLDRVAIDDIVQGFIDLGVNTVRLPFSNEMIHSIHPVPDRALGANPQLRNKTPLEVYDAAIEALTKRGIAVILNNHTNRNRWCCGLDGNERWNAAQTTEKWVEDWILMVKRYRGNPRVVGADLYNEVRRNLLKDPEWGGGDEMDWYSAAMLAGTRIQREANSDILIVIEGINFIGIPVGSFPRSRPELQPVGSLSHAFPYPDNIVYCAHFYGYTGPNATGGGDPLSQELRYRDLTPAQLRDYYAKLASYVAVPLDSDQKHYTAPVWISEFGSPGRNNNFKPDRDWWSNFIDVIIENDSDFALWPLVGWHENGQGDLWALNAYNRKGTRLSILDAGDWRLPALQKLLAAEGKTGDVSLDFARGTWRMLAPDWASQQQSNVVHAQQDAGAIFIPGEKQASCPDGLRLQALSRNAHPRALCTDVSLGRTVWDFAARPTVVVVTESTREGGPPSSVDSDFDTASASAIGRYTYSCPAKHFLIGYAYSTLTSKAAVCAPLGGGIAAAGDRRSVEFQAFPSAGHLNTHGQFTLGPDDLVGGCEDDEVAVGYTFSASSEGRTDTDAVGENDFVGAKPIAILCEKVSA